MLDMYCFNVCCRKLCMCIINLPEFDGTWCDFIYGLKSSDDTTCTYNYSRLINASGSTFRSYPSDYLIVHMTVYIDCAFKLLIDVMIIYILFHHSYYNDTRSDDNGAILYSCIIVILTSWNVMMS